MKHVIVIETSDECSMSSYRLDSILRSFAGEIEDELLNKGVASVCLVTKGGGSAIALVHEMYNAPKWDPNESR